MPTFMFLMLFLMSSLMFLMVSLMGLRFLMMFLMIYVWFDSHTCQISAFYIEFKGLKNPPQDGWHCWRLRGHWSFLTGADVLDNDLDVFLWFQKAYVRSLVKFCWFWAEILHEIGLVQWSGRVWSGRVWSGLLLNLGISLGWSKFFHKNISHKSIFGGPNFDKKSHFWTPKSHI